MILGCGTRVRVSLLFHHMRTGKNDGVDVFCGVVLLVAGVFFRSSCVALNDLRRQRHSNYYDFLSQLKVFFNWRIKLRSSCHRGAILNV